LAEIEFLKDAPITDNQSNKHDDLGIGSQFSAPGEVEISMSVYIHEKLMEEHYVMDRMDPKLAANNNFTVNMTEPMYHHKHVENCSHLAS